MQNFKITFLLVLHCSFSITASSCKKLGISSVQTKVAEQQGSQQYAKVTEPITYKIGSGRIEIKPRMKYELIISLRVLRSAEEQFQLFIPWAAQVRKNLSEITLREATTLMDNTHEWQLCLLVQDYDGPDTIKGLVEFVKDIKTFRWQNEDVPINVWASTNQRLIDALGLTPEEFPKWFADFLERYYYEGFEKQWLSEHRELVYQDAKSLASELESPAFSPIEFMEKITGRKFKGSTKIIFYPSSFSRGCAYGFSEKGYYAAVGEIGRGKNGVIATTFHELLHPLIDGWFEAERMKQPISELAKEPLFKAAWEQIGKDSYGYPEYWINELIVRAVSYYMAYKAGLTSEENVRSQSYCNYESALYDVIFKRYDTFDNIDDFIFYALTHIKTTVKDSNSQFVYIEDANKL